MNEVLTSMVVAFLLTVGTSTNGITWPVAPQQLRDALRRDSWFHQDLFRSQIIQLEVRSRLS